MPGSAHVPRRPRVLVADPDEQTRRFYSDVLQPAGYEVTQASDGREALVYALLWPPPTLVIMDTNLAFIDGYALCEILRRDAATRAMPIIVATAESRPAQLERARSTGADAILIKPCESETLLNEMRRVVGASRDLLSAIRIG